MEKEFQEVSGTFWFNKALFKDTESQPPEVVWALRKYVEMTQMQSFMHGADSFYISTIIRDQDTYFVSYTIFSSNCLVGSTCKVRKDLIVDLIREYNLNLLI